MFMENRKGKKQVFNPCLSSYEYVSDGGAESIRGQGTWHWCVRLYVSLDI